MSMLRFVIRKINVIYNSLIKFWSVRKSNEGASLTQSFAQTKAKLQLDEAGSISAATFCLLSFFVCFILLSWFCVSQLGYTFWGSWWLIFIALPFSLVAKYIYAKF